MSKGLASKVWAWVQMRLIRKAGKQEFRVLTSPAFLLSLLFHSA